MAADLQFDGICLIGFGGPEGLGEVSDFLRRVSQDRIPEERLAEVGQRYVTLGGKSPLNEQHRYMLAELAEDLKARGMEVPMRLGNRNSAPWLSDALGELYDAGCRRVLGVLTSPFPSYSGCRQYLGDVETAVTELGDRAPDVVVMPPYPQLVGLRQAAIRLLDEAVVEHRQAHVLFTAHSVPAAMNDASGPAPHGRYQVELQRLAQEVAGACSIPEDRFRLVWQSRSGSPRTPWLEPSIDDVIVELADQGVTEVIVHPIGFLTDHVEVIWDLDHQAAGIAQQHGVIMHRLPTVGFSPEFRESLADIVAAALVAGPAETDLCGKDCCYAR